MEAINNDFGSHNHHEIIKDSLLHKGKFGVEGFVLHVIWPFLDTVPVDAIQYYDKLHVLSTFATQLTKALSTRFVEVSNEWRTHGCTSLLTVIWR